MQAMVAQHLFEPFGADENALARSKDILDGIVDHSHQWDERAKGDDDKCR